MYRPLSTCLSQLKVIEKGKKGDVYAVYAGKRTQFMAKYRNFKQYVRGRIREEKGKKKV